MIILLYFRKQLRDIFNTSVLDETIMHILNMFMSNGRPHHWVGYLMPEAVEFPITKLDKLMVETRTVLSRCVLLLLTFLAAIEKKKQH